MDRQLPTDKSLAGDRDRDRSRMEDRRDERIPDRIQVSVSVCLRSIDPFYIVTHYMNWVKSSWSDRYPNKIQYIDRT